MATPSSGHGTLATAQNACEASPYPDAACSRFGLAGCAAETGEGQDPLRSGGGHVSSDDGSEEVAGTTCDDGGYGWWSGTSMATPIANGVASMIWTVDPSLTAQEVEQVMFETCEDLGNAGNDSFWGWGRADLQAAVEAAAGGACRADWNGDGAVNTQDVLAFLNDWAAGNSSADVNGDGSVNTQDVLAFLNLWTAGC